MLVFIMLDIPVFYGKILWFTGKVGRRINTEEKQMTPTVRVLISVIFYSTANLILEKRLSQYSLLSLMILWEPVMLVCGIALWGYYRYNGLPLVSPEMGWLGLLVALNPTKPN